MKALINGILVLFYLSLLVAINSCSFSNQKAQQIFNESKNKTFDIIIVPGVPFEDNKWSDIMKIRVYWSKYLYDQGITKNIIYSGSAVYSPYYEAEIMALYAEALGIPKQNIFTELRAEHSTENIYYSYKKAKKMGFKNIALATDTFQAKMLKNFINKEMKVNITLIPIVYDTLKALNSKMYDPVIDYKKAFVENFVSITDRETFWKRLKGTIGKNIDTTGYSY
jgi:vancomycin permeability regulator SanA